MNANSECKPKISGLDLINDNASSPVESEVQQNYVLVDSNANLLNKKFNRDLDSVISRAQDSGIQKIVVSGTTIHSSKEALRLTRIYPGSLYSTAGVHPHEAKLWDETSNDELESLLKNSEVVAVGECGLDFNKNFSSPEEQLLVFRKQVSLACKHRKPLVIHERDAHKELVEILNDFIQNLPAIVIHCFSGSVEEAQDYLNLGCYLGISGYIWKEKSNSGVRHMLETGVLPLDRLLVETDSPFMYPNTRATNLPDFIKSAFYERSLVYLHRYCTFQRNEPCSLLVTVEMIAAYMKKKPEQVALQTTFNAFKVFGLTA